MALQKQPVNINFAQGLNTKSDPFQIPIGQFLQLENKVFETGTSLQKRNGFASLGALPDTTYQYVTTFNSNLIAAGTSIAAYSSGTQAWPSKGSFRPLKLDTLALIRNSSNQSQCDSALSSNGLVCTVYTSTSPSTTYNYVIADSTTGQNIVAPTAISSPSESPRVFVLGNYFIILFTQAANIKYIAIPVNNVTSPSSATTLVTNYSAGTAALAYDGVVLNNNLYVAYQGTDGGGAVRMTYMNSFLVRQTASTGTVVSTGAASSIVAVGADSSRNTVWVAHYLAGTQNGYVLNVDQYLTSILTDTLFLSTTAVPNITLTATAGTATIIYEVTNTYGYGASLPSNRINHRTCDYLGNMGVPNVVLLSVGLASKVFLIGSVPYVLGIYTSSYQPSFFLIDASGTTDASGKVVGKLSYSTGGGYLTTGLPGVTVINNVASFSYLIKDQLIPTNKSQNPASNTPVFTQLGVNLASFDFTTANISDSEIGKNLFLSGGMLWAYDGYQLTEQGFHLYPDNVIVTTATGAGGLTAQDYYYVAVYEWTDNQGNIHRSAPSLAVKQTTTTASSTNTIKVPTLRLTNKSLVKIVLYRWSTAQQTYYQVTSITSPTLNSTTSNNVTITDTQADSAIVGNSILYTTGGIVENIGAPATNALTLYRSRLFLIDAEDQNLLWYSKEVIEETPVEMSDLFTLYVSPTIGAQGNTGPMKCLSSMDDKLIIFKKDAIYYMVGNGPDNTGANNDFSEPVFINSTVGSENPNSIVFIPNGLMFQSDKGIWLLGRDLSTSYIGAPVEAYNSSTVLSALTIPGTNQVRFTLDSGVTLMYDYFFNQWGTLTNAPAISSTLFQDLHTFINEDGSVFQESPGIYVDGSRPVLMKLQTGWINVAGLQGFERAYFFNLLGQYLSPHKLQVQIAYDYNSSPRQSVVISPDNFAGSYGSDPLYGNGSPLGGPGSLEQWRIFFNIQKCQAFQITITEIYDSSKGVVAGAGFTLSGLNLVVGLKSGYPRIKAANSAG